MACSMWRLIVTTLFVLNSFFYCASADQIISYVNPQGRTVYLDDNREPALYTQDFGSCLDSSKSPISVTRFDTSLYLDNMTVSFHISGNTNLHSEAVMLQLNVVAYGESRFNITWNPCGTSMVSLCPAQSSVPIQVSGYIPLGPSDLVDVPDIAFTIPDFEGQAILRIFSNTTKSEIACYTAAVTNGHSFDQTAAVGTLLGVFTLVAVVSSIATSIYGESIPDMRTHYAHSLSLSVVFAIYQHIYFTGALSLNWPKVLVSFRANFAWTSGMIYNSAMQDSLARFVGNYTGNTLLVGAAGTNVNSSSVGGGYNAASIYRRMISSVALPGALTKRQTNLVSVSDGFKWYGDLTRAGLPLPGNYSGFAGTLSQTGIPASSAFLTGFIWFLVLILLIILSFITFKLILDAIIRFKKVKPIRLNHFRRHWVRYLLFTILKACYIAFFMIIFLTVFQFSYGGAPAVLGLAGVIFTLFFVGLVGICGYACFYRLRNSKWTGSSKRIRLKKATVLRYLPWVQLDQKNQFKYVNRASVASLPGWTIERQPPRGEVPIHEDENFLAKFGWLSARFRASKWWFFAVWLGYEFIRASILAGACGHAMAQVFGLLAVEIVAFAIIMALRPYEGQRLNVLMIYLLGFSKVLTIALSSAFNVAFNIPRITATIIGVLIIIIQGLLTVALIVCIILSAISTFFSVSRYREEIKPKAWIPYREKYFAHIAQRATDQPPPSPEFKVPRKRPTLPPDPYFAVNIVRRMAKIEDEDSEFQREIGNDPRNPVAEQMLDSVYLPLTEENLSRRQSYSKSVKSTKSASSLPQRAILHRGSWAARDYSEHYVEDYPPVERHPIESYFPVHDPEAGHGRHPIESYLSAAETTRHPIDSYLSQGSFRENINFSRPRFGSEQSMGGQSTGSLLEGYQPTPGSSAFNQEHLTDAIVASYQPTGLPGMASSTASTDSLVGPYLESSTLPNSSEIPRIAAQSTERGRSDRDRRV